MGCLPFLSLNNSVKALTGKRRVKCICTLFDACSVVAISAIHYDMIMIFVLHHEVHRYIDVII